MTRGGRRKGVFSPESVERVRNAADIVSVIGRHVDLKKAGNGLKGLCPFHHEKTPSFFVSRERQTWHCFGCGAGGDVFSFLMGLLGMSFPDVLEELAAETGIELEAPRAGDARSDGLRDLLAEARRFFEEQLAGSGGSAAREYLAGRDLGSDTIRALGVGWAPDGNLLTKHLRGRGYSDSQAEESGLAIRSRDDPGRVYDRFRSRIVFPISDRRGRVVSFGGRILPGARADAPKYLNGPDTPLYRKGDLLYGYREAVKAARDLDMMILVEGYFDHARLVQAGFGCVVATCGTALTPTQARQLGSSSADILVCYDGDAAGRKAAVAAAEVILEQGSLPRIIRMPDGMDPDDFVAAEGADAVLRRIADALDPVRFALWLLGGWDEAGGPGRRVKVVRRLVSIASRASDPVIRETLLRIVAEETSYSMETLLREAGEAKPARREVQKRSIPPREVDGWDVSILTIALSARDALRERFLGFIALEDLHSENCRKLLQEIIEQYNNKILQFNFNSDELDQELVSIASMISTSFPREPTLEEVDTAEKFILEDRRKREYRLLCEKMNRASGDEKTELLKQLKLLQPKKE